MLEIFIDCSVILGQLLEVKGTSVLFSRHFYIYNGNWTEWFEIIRAKRAGHKSIEKNEDP